MREWAGLSNQGEEWRVNTLDRSVSKNSAQAGLLALASIPGLKTFSITIYIICAALSLLVFLYGLLIVKLQPRIWRNSIVRVIIVAQLINCLRFIFRPITAFTPMHVEVECRILLFLNNSFAILPVNLCIYCVVYLQIVVIHKVTPHKQWPQAMLMTLAVLISVVPASAYLYVPPTQIGINSYCTLPVIFHRKMYIFFTLSTSMWVYLSGVVGIISVTIIGIYILRTQKKTQSILLVSAYSYEPPNLVLQQSRANALHHTLVTIIWYPITPVISLWLNTILITVAYYTHREYPALEYINVVLLGLQSVFLGIALIVNPVIRNVYIEQIKKRFKAARRKSNSASQPLQPSTNHSEQQILPPLHFSCRIPSDELSSSISSL